MRVVVVGGLGNFGARICARLAHEPGIEIVATSRHVTKERRPASVQPQSLDINAHDLFPRLQSLAPGSRHPLRGALSGSGLPGCTREPRRAAPTTLTSPMAESLWRVLWRRSGRRQKPPGVSRSLGRARCRRCPRQSSILSTPRSQSSTRSMSSSPRVNAPRAALPLSRPFWDMPANRFSGGEDGRWRTVYGWQELKRERFSFGNRLAAACDVPDLELFPTRYAGVQTVTFRAALEVSLQHYGSG